MRWRKSAGNCTWFGIAAAGFLVVFLLRSDSEQSEPLVRITPLSLTLLLWLCGCDFPYREPERSAKKHGIRPYGGTDDFRNQATY